MEYVKRVRANGSMYAIVKVPTGYYVTADGAALSHPSTLDAAEQALAAVTA